jgi:TPP-dependent pyruvate/acetoin dehydrogenase alpha subunit
MLAEGSVHEAMNLASDWELPVLFVCENNRWAGAQSVRVHCAGGTIAPRAKSYGMPSEAVDGNDADAVFESAARLVARIRDGKGPSLLELLTYRMHGHSESDHQCYVDRQELEDWAGRDPVQRYALRLVEEGVCNSPDVDSFWREARAAVEEAVTFAEASPDPPPGAVLEHVWSGDGGPVDSGTGG